MAWIKTATGYTDGRFSINRSPAAKHWIMLDGTTNLGTRGRLRNAKAVCENIRATQPPCAASMGCLCAGHARGNPASEPCNTDED